MEKFLCKPNIQVSIGSHFFTVVANRYFRCVWLLVELNRVLVSYMSQGLQQEHQFCPTAPALTKSKDGATLPWWTLYNLEKENQI